ncbi:MAG TPA: hypothetical protein VG323_20595, partial [Thermoanaerobaculia bacterium]|nr:hypothetical protein [Thermoanaerobaculia bacterium]
MIRMKILFAILLAVPLLAAESPQYAPSTEVHLRGDVLYLSEGPGGVFAIMKDGHNEIEVRLAPKSFLESKGVVLRVGNVVTVTGSRTEWRASEVVLARELTVGSST